MVPEQTNEEAMLHQAEYFMEMGGAEQPQHRLISNWTHCSRPPGLLPGHDSESPDAANGGQRRGRAGRATRFRLNLSKADSLNLEDRIYLAMVLLNSKHNLDAIKQSAACMAMADEKSMRHLVPERLEILLQLAANLPAGSYPAKTFDLGVSLLPKPYARASPR